MDSHYFLPENGEFCKSLGGGGGGGSIASCPVLVLAAFWVIRAYVGGISTLWNLKSRDAIRGLSHWPFSCGSNTGFR